MLARRAFDRWRGSVDRRFSIRTAAGRARVHRVAEEGFDPAGDVRLTAVR